eukprot:1146966-Pelagomonas_calceolata.AAC.10
MNILSNMLINLLAPGALLRILLLTLITEIREGVLLVTLLNPIDFFLLPLLVKEIHGASALGSASQAFRLSAGHCIAGVQTKAKVVLSCQQILPYQ